MASGSTMPQPAATTDGGSLRRLYEGTLIALFAAVLGYALHHLPPLRDHPVEGVVAALAAAVAGAVALGRLVSPPAAYELPAILLPPPGGAEVRPLSRADIDFCVALHAKALPHGFFVDLGSRFMRAYYASLLESPHALAFAATISGQPVGFLVGLVDPRRHTMWLLRHRGPALALRAALGIAAHPEAGYRFVRTRVARYARAWRRHRGNPPATPADEAAPAVLAHVAVLPGARRAGAGRRLVDAFEAAARSAGASRAVLTTLEGPLGAGPFYASLGWTHTATHTTPDGRRAAEWSRTLHPRDGS
jgi:GNAT superfamily N-acetyltransferase